MKRNTLILLASSLLLAGTSLTGCSLIRKLSSKNSSTSSYISEQSSEKEIAVVEPFSEIYTSDNLVCKASAGVGTFLGSRDSSKQTITLMHPSNNSYEMVSNTLVDGSFDHINRIIHTPNVSGTGLHPVNGSIPLNEVTNSNLLRFQRDDGACIYTAVTFKLTFEFDCSKTSTDHGLFLDCVNDEDMPNESRFNYDGETPTTAKDLGWLL